MCRGLAKQLKMTITGRRNVYGSILGKRRCMWQSGTTPLFAAVFRSNMHTPPNHRVPICPETHETSCKNPTCLKNLGCSQEMKRVSKLAQRVQREVTG